MKRDRIRPDMAGAERQTADKEHHVNKRFWHSLILGVAILGGVAASVQAQDTVGPAAEPLAQGRSKAAEFLIASQQPDGSWTSE